MGKYFTGVGEFTINGKDVTIEGVTSFEGGEFNRVEIDGVVNLKGELKAGDLGVDGVFNASADVMANKLGIDGVANFGGNVRCHRAEVDGVMNLNGGKLEADTLSCDGVVKSNGEINADKVTAEGTINAREIYGDEVKICSHPNTAHGILSGIGKFLKGMSLDNDIEKFQKMQSSDIGIIEATKVNLEYAAVKQVCGSEVTIGEGCYVESVDCDGILKISRYAVVKNISGNHTRVEID